jgi:hypothetical protein
MRRIAAHVVVLVGYGIAYVAAVPLHDRTPSGTPPGSRHPRMPMDTPISGTYDVSTITPFERPQGVPLTPSPKRKPRRENSARRRCGDQPSDGGASATGGDGSAGAAGMSAAITASGSTRATPDRDRQRSRSSIVVDPPNGRVPRKPRAANAPVLLTSDAGENAGPTGRGAYDNVETRPLADRCLLGFGSTSGPPTLPNGFYNNTKQIVQTPGYVMILNEMVHDARIIHRQASTRASASGRATRSAGGGDTLVVGTRLHRQDAYAGSAQSESHRAILAARREESAAGSRSTIRRLQPGMER